MSKPNIKTIDIIADAIDPNTKQHLEVQKGARGIAIKDNAVLLVYETKKDYYTLPGGGIQSHETPEAAVRREILEETGFNVLNARATLIINQTFADSRWQHHYFVCEIADTPVENALTKAEETLGLTPVFKSVEEALMLFTTHQPKHFDPYFNTIQKREFLGLIHSL